MIQVKKGDKVHWERWATCALAEVLQAGDPAAKGENSLPEILIHGDGRLRTANIHSPEGCTRPVANTHHAA